MCCLSLKILKIKVKTICFTSLADRIMYYILYFFFFFLIKKLCDKFFTTLSRVFFYNDVFPSGVH